MKNFILAITKDSIPYIKELRSLAKSVTGCILMQQLDYWFARYPNGFYKFQAPCNNEKYKEGDSWEEELGISADEFRTAFDKFGFRYKSKKDFLATSDKFDSNQYLYISYTDKFKGLTYYFRNHDFVDNSIQECFKDISKKAKKADETNNWQMPYTELGNGNTHNLGNPYTELGNGNTHNLGNPYTELGNGNTDIKQRLHSETTTESESRPSSSPQKKLEELKNQIQANPLFELWVDAIKNINQIYSTIDNIDQLALNDCALALLSDGKQAMRNPKNWLEISYKKILDTHIQNQKLAKSTQELAITEQKKGFYDSKAEAKSPYSSPADYYGEPNTDQYSGPEASQEEPTDEEREAIRAENIRILAKKKKEMLANRNLKYA